MIEVQARVVRHLERATASRPEDALVLVSHAEVIRAALIYCLGLSLDAWRLFEISPASITKLSVNGGGATVLSVNEAAG
jgi:probable phosphoglycerate mutase